MSGADDYHDTVLDYKLISTLKGGPPGTMLKYLQTALIMLAILALGCSSAAQPAEINKNAQPAAAAVPAQPTGAVAAAPAAQEIATELTIKSVRVTSPSREDVVVLPTNDNKTVPARVWETLDLECIAADQAGHNLTYAWSCSAGKLRGEGAKVIWTAPGAGDDYTVTVNVSCDKGEKKALTLDMRVKCCGN